MKVLMLQMRGFFSLIGRAILGSEKNFTSGNINKAIMLLAIPMVLEMLMESLFVCANLYFVSRLGEGAIAMVGASESVISFAYSIAIGLSISAAAVISRRVGEQKYKTAGLSAMQIIYIASTLGVLISLFCVVFAQDILLLIGLKKALVIESKTFAQLMFASIGFIILRIAVNGIFRGAGDASIAMRTLWISNALNILLCPVFIFGWAFVPTMGLLGVAIATLIARIVGVLYQSWFLIKGKTIIVIGRKQLLLVPSLIKKTGLLAFNGAIQYMIPASSWMLMIKIVAHFGSNALAGYIIAQRVASIATMPAWGIGNAAGILTGQNLGAGNADRAEQSVWRAGMINMGFLLLIALFWWQFAPPIVGFFSQVPDVINNGIMYIHIISMAYVLLAFTMVISRALNASGNVKVVTLLYILMFYVTQLPLAYLLGIVLHWGTKGIFTAILVSELVLAIACIIVFKRGQWKHTKI